MDKKKNTKNPNRLKLYYIDDSLVKYLSKTDKNIWWNKKNPNNTARANVGILIEMGELIYIAPITSDLNKVYRKSKSKTVIKLVKHLPENKEIYYGAVLLSYMVPVTKDLIVDVRKNGNLTIKKQTRHSFELEIINEKNKNGKLVGIALEHYRSVVFDKVNGEVARSLKYLELEEALIRFLENRGITITIDKSKFVKMAA